jgi:hypothetical protein
MVSCTVRAFRCGPFAVRLNRSSPRYSRLDQLFAITHFTFLVMPINNVQKDSTDE